MLLKKKKTSTIFSVDVIHEVKVSEEGASELPSEVNFTKQIWPPNNLCAPSVFSLFDVELPIEVKQDSISTSFPIQNLLHI